jgi:glutamate racemase
MPNALTIYDTSLSSLSLIIKLRQQMPNLAINYIVDDGFGNYNQKSYIQIQERAKQVCKSAFDIKSNLVVLGSDILMTVCLKELSSRWLQNEGYSGNKQIIGLHSHNFALESKYWHLRDMPLALFANSTSLRTGFLQSALLDTGFRNGTFIPCDEIVNTLLTYSEEMVKFGIKKALLPFADRLKDMCSVYLYAGELSLVKNELKQFFMPSTLIMDSSDIMAENLFNYLEKHPNFKLSSGDITCYATGRAAQVSGIIHHFIAEDWPCKKLSI